MAGQSHGAHDHGRDGVIGRLHLAQDDDDVGPLFDWYGNGDVGWNWQFSDDAEHTCRTTQASKDFMQAVYPRIGAVVIGRRLFDLTDGWDGVPPAGDHVFVVTHSPPTDWKHAGTAPFTFVAEGVEAAITQARELAGPDVTSTSPPARSAGKRCVWA